MSSTIVFDTSRNTGDAVFEYDQQPSGTLYSKTLTATQTSTVLLATVTGIPNLVKSVVQASQVTLTRLISHALSVTQTSTHSVQTETTLNTACVPVAQSSTATLRRDIGWIRSVVQTPIVTLLTQFSGGAGHTTYQITLDAVQNSTAAILKGIQTIKNTLAGTEPTLERAFDAAGVVQIDLPMNVAQASSASLAQTIIRHGVLFTTGGWLLETKLKKIEKRNAAILRAERERERLAKEKADRLAAEELRRQIAEQRLAEIQQLMKAKEVVDAPFKAAYEAQIQQLARENALLRAELESLKQ
jgi:hypothetical protein